MRRCAILLVVHCLDGLKLSLTKGAEDSGEATGERIKKSLGRLFSGHSDVTRDEAVEAVADGSAVGETPEQVSVARDAARMRLMDALVENGVPADRAFALLWQVQSVDVSVRRAAALRSTVIRVRPARLPSTLTFGPWIGTLPPTVVLGAFAGSAFTLGLGHPAHIAGLVGGGQRQRDTVATSSY